MLYAADSTYKHTEAGALYAADSTYKHTEAGALEAVWISKS